MYLELRSREVRIVDEPLACPRVHHNTRIWESNHIILAIIRLEEIRN